MKLWAWIVLGGPFIAAIVMLSGCKAFERNQNVPTPVPNADRLAEDLAAIDRPLAKAEVAAKDTTAAVAQAQAATGQTARMASSVEQRGKGASADEFHGFYLSVKSGFEAVCRAVAASQVTVDELTATRAALAAAKTHEAAQSKQIALLESQRDDYKSKLDAANASIDRLNAALNGKTTATEKAAFWMIMAGGIAVVAGLCILFVPYLSWVREYGVPVLLVGGGLLGVGLFLDVVSQNPWILWAGGCVIAAAMAGAIWWSYRTKPKTEEA